MAAAYKAQRMTANDSGNILISRSAFSIFLMKYFGAPSVDRHANLYRHALLRRTNPNNLGDPRLPLYLNVTIHIFKLPFPPSDGAVDLLVLQLSLLC